MPRLQLKNFKGMGAEDILWPQAYARYVAGVDVFGIRDDTSRMNDAGVLHGMPGMAAGSEAASPNDVTDLIQAMAYFPTDGSVWGLSFEAEASGSPRLYQRNSGVWTLQRSGNGSGTGDLLTTAGGGGIAAHAGSLWIVQLSRVSRWTGAAYTQSFASLSSSASGPRPTAQFAGNLLIGNGRYIDKIDSTPTFTAAALTLPADFVVKSIEVFGDRVYIMADNGNFSRIFIWDGTSTTYESFFDLLEEPIAPVLRVAGGILWVVATRTSGKTPIYTFNGTAFERILLLPLYLGGQTNQWKVKTYAGGILIAGNGNNVSAFEDGVGGLWLINRNSVSEPFHAILAMMPASGVIDPNLVLGAIQVAGSSVYVGTQNTSTSAFEVWEAQSGNPTKGIYQTLAIDAGDVTKIKTWLWIRLDSDLANDGSGSGRQVTIKYRVNYGSTWTTLKTISPGSVDANASIAIMASGRVIEIRFEILSTGGANLSTRVYGFTLGYR